MLEILDQLPADVRARIERALIEAERVLTAAEGKLVDVPRSRSRYFAVCPIFRLIDEIRVPTVLNVVAVSVDALSEHARNYHWTATRLRSTVEAVITVIARYFFEQFRPRATPFDAFKDEILGAARATPAPSWWTRYQQVLEERSVAIIPLGVQVQEQLDDLGWRPKDLGDRCHPPVSARTIERLIAGGRTSHRSNVRQWEAILSDEKQEDVRFILPPKRRKTSAKRRRKRR